MDADAPEIAVGTTRGGLYLGLRGHATQRTCPTANRLVDDYLASGPQPPTVVVDVAGCEWVDSTFAGWMLQIRAKLAALGCGSISLAGCSDACRKSLDKLGMPALIHDRKVRCPDKLTTVACGDGGLSKRGIAELMARAHEELASLDDEHRQVFGPIAEALRKELDAGN